MNKSIANFIIRSMLWAAMGAGSVPVHAPAQQSDIISTEGDSAQACAEAKATEDERHRRQLLELQKAGTDALKNYNNRLIMCKADEECREQAEQELHDKQRNIQMQRNEENAEHANRQLDIGQQCQTANRQPPLKSLQPKLDPRTPTTWTDARGNEQPLSNRYVYTGPDGRSFAFPKIIDERATNGKLWKLDPKSIIYQKNKKGAMNAQARYRNQSNPQEISDPEYGVWIRN